MINKCINYQSSSNRNPPLLKLISSNHCNKDWIELYLSLDDGTSPIDLNISSAKGINCIQCCEEQNKIQWKYLLQQYQKNNSNK